MEYSVLLETDRAEVVPVVEEALRSAGIPFQSGLQSVPAPRVLFSVPSSRVDEARVVVDQFLGTRPLASDDEEPDDERPDDDAAAVFPWAAVRACAALVIVHFAVLFALVGIDPTGRRLVAAGGLVGGAGWSQAWRLLTHLFVHSDPRHVLWNALSMVAFAVPLFGTLGATRTAAIYLLSGIGGGVAALLAYPPGTVTVGSSGAVAGLFGAWLVRTLATSRSTVPGSRARLKVIGVGLLVLPSLVTPSMDDGTRISVAAHLGGATTGALVGALLLLRERGTHVNAGSPRAGAPPGASRSSGARP